MSTEIGVDTAEVVRLLEGLGVDPRFAGRRTWSARTTIDGGCCHGPRARVTPGARESRPIEEAAPAFLRWRLVAGATRRGELVRASATRCGKRRGSGPAGVDRTARSLRGGGEVQEMIDICDFATACPPAVGLRSLRSGGPGPR